MIRATTDIILREAEGRDIPLVREILWTTWVDTYGPFIPHEDLTTYFDLHYSESELRTLLQADDVTVDVALVEGKGAGTMITRHSRKEGRFYVSSLYVLPSRQGLGIGGRLLRKAEERATERGLNALWLGVMVQNVKAVAWYERLGFRFEQKEPFTMGGTTVEHFIGWKPIAPPSR